MIITKERIDTGIKNNPSTGDVLNDGGIKINSVIDDVYNKFGDTRLNVVAHGVGKQVIHATGYYQKYPTAYYTRVLEHGSMHDIDTTLGAITARLPKAKVGECIEIINSNGSITGSKHIRIQCSSTDSFIDGTMEKFFRNPNIRIILWGVSDENGVGKWDYKVEDLYSKTLTPVDVTIMVQTTGTTIDIADIEEYNVIKFLVYFNDGNAGLSKSSEVMLHINPQRREVLHSEYAVVSSDPVEMFDLKFFLDDDIIKLTVKTNMGNNSIFKMRAIETL